MSIPKVANAIRSVEARQESERTNAYVRTELRRGWLAIEADILFPFASVEFRREYVDLGMSLVTLANVTGESVAA